jgi:hypothetical protein
MAGSGNRTDRRSPEAVAYRRLYKTAQWKRARAKQLGDFPFCAMCEDQGRHTPATVCDHEDPKTKLDPRTFFAGPFQSLCDVYPWRCHSSRKQQQETRGFATDVGHDGLPTDPAHPFYR